MVIQDGMTLSSLISDNSWPETLSYLSSLTDLDATAREHNAFRRARGVRTVEDQLRLALGYGVGLSLRQSSAWAGAANIAAVSNPALLRRLSNCSDWLEHLTMRLVEDAQTQPSGEWAGTRLRVVDATSLSCPGAHGTTWRIHLSYDLTGRVDDLTLTGAREGESLGRFDWQTGDIAIADRGYAKAKDLRKVVQAGADFMVRIGWNALRLVDAQGQPFDLFGALDAVADEPASMSVSVDTREQGVEPLPLRLIISSLPHAQAEQARKKVQATASKKGKTLDPRSLQAAGYVLILTSLSEERSSEAVLALYRMRWQIELLFKRFKSLSDLGDLPAKSEKLAKTWIFAKLIIALLAEKMARHAAESFPSGHC